MSSDSFRLKPYHSAFVVQISRPAALLLHMYSDPSFDATQLWMKLTSQSRSSDDDGIVLCSYKEDEDLGHRCLLTEEDEDPMTDPHLGKFRGHLIPVEGTDNFFISNAKYGGRLYVSDYTFETAETTMTSVYVRPADTAIIDSREVWHFHEMAGGLSRVINTYKGQALCDTCVEANSKGDRWLGVTGECDDDSYPCYFASQLVAVGS